MAGSDWLSQTRGTTRANRSRLHNKVLPPAPRHLNGDVAVIIPPTPNGKRGGVMLAQEGDRWTVTLIGHFGQQAPSDLEGFVRYASTIPAPYIYKVLQTPNL